MSLFKVGGYKPKAKLRQYLLPSDLRPSITSSWRAEMIKRPEVACEILDLGIRGQRAGNHTIISKLHGEWGRYVDLNT